MVKKHQPSVSRTQPLCTRGGRTDSTPFISEPTKCTISSQVKENITNAHSICTRPNTRVGGSPEQIIHSYILRATNHVRTCANYELSKGFVFRPHRAVGGENRVCGYRSPFAQKPD